MSFKKDQSGISAAPNGIMREEEEKDQTIKRSLPPFSWSAAVFEATREKTREKYLNLPPTFFAPKRKPGP